MNRMLHDAMHASVLMIASFVCTAIGVAQPNITTGGDNGVVEATLQQIDVARKQVFELPEGSDDRLDKLEHLLRLRRNLIALDEFHPNRPVWQGDLAFDLLFVAGTESGLNLEIEFGITTPAMRTHYLALADEAFALIDEAIVGIADTILDLEEQPHFQDDVNLQQRRRHLVQNEQQQRLPLILASALFAQANANRSHPQWPGAQEHLPDRRDNHTVWAEIVTLADELELVLNEPWRTRLQTYAAVASYRLEQPTSAKARLTVLTTRAISRREDVFRLFALRRMLALSSIAPPITQSDPFWNLLYCDLVFGERLDAANTTQVPRVKNQAEWLLDAYVPFVNMASESSTQLSEDARDRMVGEHVARVIPPSIPTAALPPAVVLAQAQRGIRHDAARDDARNTLLTLSQRADLSKGMQLQIAITLAKAATMDGDSVAALQQMLGLYQDWPNDDDVRRTFADAVLQMLRFLQEARSSPENVVTHEALLQTAVEVAFAGDMNAIPHANDIAFHMGKYHANSNRSAEAITMFGIVESASRWYRIAAYESAVAHFAIANKFIHQKQFVSTESREHLASCRLDAANAINASVNDAPDSHVDAAVLVASATLLTARVALLLNEHEEALAILDANESLFTKDSTWRIETLQLRTDALRQLGRSDEAEEELQRLIAESPNDSLRLIHRMVASVYGKLQQRERLGSGRETIQDDARLRLQPLAEMEWNVVQQVQSATDDDRLRARFHKAEALRMGGSYDLAERELKNVVQGWPNSAQAILALAECKYQLGDSAQAMRLFTQIAKSFDDDRPWMYWQAELRMLQSLDRADRNTDRIFPYIQRLRQKDSQLGGQALARQFSELERKYSP